MYTTIGDSWMSPFKIVYHFGPERSQNLNQQWAVRAAAVLSFRRRPVISEDLALLANGANDLWRCSQRNFWGRATRIGHSHCLTVFMVVDTFGFSFQTRRFNPCRLSEFFMSRYSHLHRSNIRHHAQSSFPNNKKNVFWFVPSSVRAAFFFSFVDWFFALTHPFLLMLFADLSRSSEKDRLAVLYHRKKGSAKTFGWPFDCIGCCDALTRGTRTWIIRILQQ